jgi:predicted O-methyltransferase YrrM
MLATFNNSKTIIECGTSFGVSTIYLALAAGQNAGGKRAAGHGVITMEKNLSKLAKAKANWAECGPEVEGYVDAREGDLLAILGADESLPKTVDFVFLDGAYLPSLNCRSYSPNH